MAQDIRDLFENEPKDETVKMSKGHEARFLEKLEKELPQEQQSAFKFGFFNVAASIIVLLGLIYGFRNTHKSNALLCREQRLVCGRFTESPDS